MKTKWLSIIFGLLISNLTWATCPAVSNSGSDGVTIDRTDFASIYMNGTNMIIRGRVSSGDYGDFRFAQNTAPIEVIASCLQNARAIIMMPASNATAYGAADNHLVMYGSMTLTVSSNGTCQYSITDSNGLQCILSRTWH